MDREIVKEIINTLNNLYPDAVPQLEYSTSFELLIAVILSAQCTDKRVNLVTKELFKKYNNPQALANINVQELESIIFTCGLYKSKAKHIIEASQSILENFGGQVPSSLKDLQSLSGVGRKTANVVYSVAFGGDAIAVDTHVFRVSNRIGLSKANNVLQTEIQLMETIPQKQWSKSHHLIIYHGRNICKAQNPLCSVCAINNYCEYFKTNLKIIK